MTIRFAIVNVTRDRRTEYLRACGDAIAHQQRLRYERLKARLQQERLAARAN